ncbi:2Fe-2S iron-sulfur cluster binding domain-containing protein [Massilia sp. NEAU-DD11]|uniref:2Fe-2S iron-sulfur cluster binding domain-containing protein n=1 Tax=Massilia cellulosiltytica TaxID=2683234 RepID=A0A7X3KAE5_9BURK|nr:MULTISPECIES: 2Fe-2S iron-sulfur cluster-binding protein [Telluria group]KQZ35002.1 naphthalene 1,2-dioxygenase [Massilia sp. Root1485]MVW62941.1 2Fe-2S iron-sulfur cluster binding domain-containing protein [Telluria cellulosilytica]
MELVIEPHHRTLAVKPGATLLEVLRDNGIPVSYSCMAGRCGTCRCKVVAGSVLETGRDTKPRGAEDGNYVLACMSVLTESCTIELPEPDEIVTHPARIVKATVVSIENATHDILRLRLRPAKPLAFSPGQYAMLQFTPDHIRPYSMAGLCDDGELEFHVRLVPEGKVTGYIDRQLKPGQTVRVSGPLGTAYLRRNHEGPMLCVAGGTGLAPVLSIVRGAIAAGMRNSIHVYFGVRTPDDIYGTRWLHDLAAEHDNVKVHIVVTSGTGPGLRTGLVTDAVVEDWDDLTGWRAYLCGAPPMVEAATLLVKRKGVKAEHVYADAFYASAA